MSQQQIRLIPGLHTDGLFPLAPRRSKLLQPLVSYTGLVQSQSVSGLFMQCVDLSIALLGNLLAGFLKCAGHFR